MSKKYQGNSVKINPLWENVKLLFITTTLPNFVSDIKAKPLFLFIYKQSLHFGICNYEFKFLKNYQDFKIDNEKDFNQFFPNLQEFNFLKSMNPTYYKLDYQKTINQKDLGDFSDYELELLKEWNRELSINKLFN